MNILFLQVFWVLSVSAVFWNKNPPPPNRHHNSESEPDTLPTSNCPPQQLQCPPPPDCPKLRPPPPPQSQECPKPPPPPPPQKCPQPTPAANSCPKPSAMNDTQRPSPPPPPAECPKQPDFVPECLQPSVCPCVLCVSENEWKSDAEVEQTYGPSMAKTSSASSGKSRRSEGGGGDGGWYSFNSFSSNSPSTPKKRLTKDSPYGSYQGGVQCTDVVRLIQLPIPKLTMLKSLETVNWAPNIKAHGRLYSISDAGCAPLLAINMSAVSHIEYNKTSKLVTVGAGATLGNLMRHLHRLNRTLLGIPSFGSVTIGGALAMGSHGSSLKRNTSLSDLVVSMKVVHEYITRVYDATHPDFNAFRVNLGLLGIVYEATFNTTQQYKVRITHAQQNDAILNDSFGKIEAMARTLDYFQVYWFPVIGKVVLSAGNISTAEPRKLSQVSLYPEISETTALQLSNKLEKAQAQQSRSFASELESTQLRHILNCSLHKSKSKFVGNCRVNESESIGYSHNMIMDECKSCYWSHKNSSVFWDAHGFAVPLDKAGLALQKLYKIVKDGRTAALFGMDGIWLRFVTPSKSLMGVNYGDRPVMTVEWKSVQRRDKNELKLGLSVYQAMSKELMFTFGARPHWSKNGLYYSSQAILEDGRWKNLATFRRAMKNFDRGGQFLNSFGERVAGLSDKMTVREDYNKSCAANDACSCSPGEEENKCGWSALGEHKCEYFSDEIKMSVCNFYLVKSNKK